MDVRAQWMRGGTSKCWVFDKRELDEVGLSADELLPRLFGSPDPRQLDGVGGATSTTSKAIIVEPSTRAGVDVDYTFAQVGIEEEKVDWGSNCGNCSATVSLYALQQGWVQPAADLTRLTTFNTNTDQVVVQHLRTPDGALPERPVATIPGVRFPGVEVGLGFVDPEGKTTGSLLPTGRAQDTLTVGGAEYDVSLVDAGAPLVLIPSTSLGLLAADYERWAHRVTPLLETLDSVRRAGAVAMGLAGEPHQAERAIPKVGLVSPSTDTDADAQILMLSMGRPHPAMPITGSVATTMASRVAGSVLADALGGAPSGQLRLRTPSGVLSTFIDRLDGATVVGVTRTARTLASATLPIPSDLQPDRASTVDRPNTKK